MGIQPVAYILHDCAVGGVLTEVQNPVRFRCVRSERSILRRQICRPLLGAPAHSSAIPRKSRLTVLGSPPKDPYII